MNFYILTYFTPYFLNHQTLSYNISHTVIQRPNNLEMREGTVQSTFVQCFASACLSKHLHILLLTKRELLLLLTSGSSHLCQTLLSLHKKHSLRKNAWCLLVGSRRVDPSCAKLLFAKNQLIKVFNKGIRYRCSLKTMFWALPWKSILFSTLCLIFHWLLKVIKRSAKW